VVENQSIFLPFHGGNAGSNPAGVAGPDAGAAFALSVERKAATTKEVVGIHVLLSYSFFDPVADSLRYQVLQESGGRCALCGATAKDAVLQVEHILPRSRGGSNEKSTFIISHNIT
jgi:hypothetical protein